MYVRIDLCVWMNVCIYIYIYIQSAQEEWSILRESVPYVKLYRYNPKHLYSKLNSYVITLYYRLRYWVVKKRNITHDQVIVFWLLILAVSHAYHSIGPNIWQARRREMGGGESGFSVYISSRQWFMLVTYDNRRTLITTIKSHHFKRNKQGKTYSHYRLITPVETSGHPISRATIQLSELLMGLFLPSVRNAA